MLPPPPRSTLFPYTTLFRSLRFIVRRLLITIPTILIVISLTWGLIRLAPGNFYSGEKKIPKAIDRKSTRLNSSHEWISYAVFCLKKKTRQKQPENVERDAVS